MHELTILSRDAGTLARLIEQAALPSLRIVQAASNAQQLDAGRVTLLLAEPDLALPLLEHCPQLRWLQSTWSGNAPLIRGPRKDYLLTAAKGIFDSHIREYVAAYLLHFSRNIDGFHPGATGAHNAPSAAWQSVEVSQLAGSTLGILGAGSMARALLPMARVFDMRVIGLNRSGHSDDAYDQRYAIHDWQAFAPQCDYLVSLLPDTPETKGYINAAFLKALPKHAVLINAGRGSSIVEQDLIDALDQGQLRAAVLDVFEQEPLPAQHRLWHHPKIWVTQHTAAISEPQAVASVFCDNFQRWCEGQPLNYVVDFARGY